MSSVLCAQCGAPLTSKGTPSVCGGPCGLVPYCGAQCQAAHWPEHSTQCAALGAIVAKLEKQQQQAVAADAADAAASHARVPPPQPKKSAWITDPEEIERKVRPILMLGAYPVDDIARRLTPHDVRSLILALWRTHLKAALTDPLLWRLFYNRDFGQYDEGGADNRVPLVAPDAETPMIKRYWQSYARWVSMSPSKRWDLQSFRELGRRSARGELPDASIAADLHYTPVVAAAARGDAEELRRLVEEDVYSVVDDNNGRDTVLAALIYGSSQDTARIVLPGVQGEKAVSALYDALRASNYGPTTLLEDQRRSDFALYEWLLFSNKKIAAALTARHATPLSYVAATLSRTREGADWVIAGIDDPQFSAATRYRAGPHNTVPLAIATRWHKNARGAEILQKLIERADFDVNERDDSTDRSVPAWVASAWRKNPHAAALLRTLIDLPDFQLRHAPTADHQDTVAHEIAQWWADIDGGLGFLQELTQRSDYVPYALSSPEPVSVEFLIAEHWNKRGEHDVAALLLGLLKPVRPQALYYYNAEYTANDARKLLLAIAEGWHDKAHAGALLVAAYEPVHAARPVKAYKFNQAWNGMTAPLLIARKWASVPEAATVLVRMNELDVQEPGTELLYAMSTLVEPLAGLNRVYTNVALEVAEHWSEAPRGLEVLAALMQNPDFRVQHPDGASPSVAHLFARHWSGVPDPAESNVPHATQLMYDLANLWAIQLRAGNSRPSVKRLPLSVLVASYWRNTQGAYDVLEQLADAKQLKADGSYPPEGSYVGWPLFAVVVYWLNTHSMGELLFRLYFVASPFAALDVDRAFLTSVINPAPLTEEAANRFKTLEQLIQNVPPPPQGATFFDQRPGALRLVRHAMSKRTLQLDYEPMAKSL